MKNCPVFDCECPYLRVKTNSQGETDCFCSLTHPEEDCDDYYYLMGEDE